MSIFWESFLFHYVFGLLLLIINTEHLVLMSLFNVFIRQKDNRHFLPSGQVDITASSVL